MKTVKNVHHVKINFFFSRSRFLKSRLFNRDLAASRFSSRLSRFLRFVEICRDFQDLLRLFEIYRDISTLSRLFEVLHHQKSSQIEKSRSRNRIKLTNSHSRSRQTVEICQKCHVLTYFSISIETFETGRWCRDKIIETSRLSRLRFWKCRDFLDCWDQPFSIVKIESLDRDHVETNRDPHAY